MWTDSARWSSDLGTPAEGWACLTSCPGLKPQTKLTFVQTLIRNSRHTHRMQSLTLAAAVLKLNPPCLQICFHRNARTCSLQLTEMGRSRRCGLVGKHWTEKKKRNRERFHSLLWKDPAPVIFGRFPAIVLDHEAPSVVQTEFHFNQKQLKRKHMSFVSLKSNSWSHKGFDLFGLRFSFFSDCTNHQFNHSAICWLRSRTAEEAQ